MHNGECVPIPLRNKSRPDPSVGHYVRTYQLPSNMHAGYIRTSVWNVVMVPSTGMLSPLPLGCVLTDMAKRGIVPVLVVALLTKLQTYPACQSRVFYCLACKEMANWLLRCPFLELKMV